MSFSKEQRRAVCLALNKVWPKLPRLFKEEQDDTKRARFVAVDLDDLPGEGMSIGYDGTKFVLVIRHICKKGVTR